MLDTIAAKITRVDVAHDDYKGERGLELAKELYDLGEFVTAVALLRPMYRAGTTVVA
ncbi:hypothetical protein [Luteibacter mycovicinus]|uniref:hypothetical protein n=1 Tax=Luteibacter mycovicinus TaxID=1500890 RepID=UPI0012E09F2D|nr:hypothetical protein [Luteibacter sp. 9143a]